MSDVLELQDGGNLLLEDGFSLLLEGGTSGAKVILEAMGGTNSSDVIYGATSTDYDWLEAKGLIHCEIISEDRLTTGGNPDQTKVQNEAARFATAPYVVFDIRSWVMVGSWIGGTGSTLAEWMTYIRNWTDVLTWWKEDNQFSNVGCWGVPNFENTVEALRVTSGSVKRTEDLRDIAAYEHDATGLADFVCPTWYWWDNDIDLFDEMCVEMNWQATNTFCGKPMYPLTWHRGFKDYYPYSWLSSPTYKHILENCETYADGWIAYGYDEDEMFDADTWTSSSSASTLYGADYRPPFNDHSSRKMMRTVRDRIAANPGDSFQGVEEERWIRHLYEMLVKYDPA